LKFIKNIRLVKFLKNTSKINKNIKTLSLPNILDNYNELFLIINLPKIQNNNILKELNKSSLDQIKIINIKNKLNLSFFYKIIKNQGIFKKNYKNKIFYNFFIKKYLKFTNKKYLKKKKINKRVSDFFLNISNQMRNTKLFKLKS